MAERRTRLARRGTACAYHRRSSRRRACVGARTMGWLGASAGARVYGSKSRAHRGRAGRSQKLLGSMGHWAPRRVSAATWLQGQRHAGTGGSRAQVTGCGPMVADERTASRQTFAVLSLLRTRLQGGTVMLSPNTLAVVALAVLSRI